MNCAEKLLQPTIFFNFSSFLETSPYVTFMHAFSTDIDYIVMWGGRFNVNPGRRAAFMWSRTS